MRYLPLVIAGDGPGLLALFDNVPLIDDVRFGRIANISALDQFLALGRQWYTHRQAQVVPVALTAASDRAVYECLVHLQPGGTGGPGEPWALPVALAADLDQATHTLNAVRAYHSLWPLLGAHQVRGPLLPRHHRVKLPEPVAAYLEALGRGDLEGVLAQFEPGAVVREPSGGPFAHQGSEAIRAFYAGLLAGGGVALEHTGVTDDGTRTAVEYTLLGLGGRECPAQAGLAVYERGPSGRLAAARIYDDVDVKPPASETGGSAE
jgi:hypothetical protein